MSVRSSHCVIDMGRPADLAAHALRTVLLASVIPMGLFYAALLVFGLKTAITVAVLWYYAGLALRVTRGRPLLGTAMLGASLMTVRAVVGFWTGSAFVFFLQPVAGTIATATALALTALAGRPLLERLAHDFVPVPSALASRLRHTRFFGHASMVWALTYMINAFGTVWLLTRSSLGSFLILKTVLSPVLTAIAIATTYALFRTTMRREGVQLRWGLVPAAA
jgi:hypothetical protein